MAERKLLEYHPFTLDKLEEALGYRSARINLAACLKDARSDDPELKKRIDQFIKDNHA